MPPTPELRVIQPRTALDDRAEADLRFIRGTMERATRFSAVPGRGAVWMGLTAIAGSIVAASFAIGSDAWLATWVATAVVGLAVGAVTLTAKAKRAGTPLSRGVGRRFLLCLCPSLVVGALLTVALVRAGSFHLLPATWLLCYGAGVTAAGALSPAVIPLSGSTLLLLGGIAVVAPPTWGGALMTVGFGVVHIVAGVVVARHHGG